MSHIVQIEDANGQLVELHYYCSDSCAKTDTLYTGWYGCHETTGPEMCLACGEGI